MTKKAPTRKARPKKPLSIEDKMNQRILAARKRPGALAIIRVPKGGGKTSQAVNMAYMASSLSEVVILLALGTSSAEVMSRLNHTTLAAGGKVRAPINVFGRKTNESTQFEHLHMMISGTIQEVGHPVGAMVIDDAEHYKPRKGSTMERDLNELSALHHDLPIWVFLTDHGAKAIQPEGVFNKPISLAKKLARVPRTKR